VNTVLFGIKGCGKSILGKQVAVKLKRAFIDTDYLIEEIYQTHRKKRLGCREIYEEVGEIGFRTLEYEVIQSLQDVQHSVIAVGGGAMLSYDNVDALRKSSLLFYLFCEREVLKRRLFSQDVLPYFIDLKDPDASFDRTYDERDESYRKLDAHILNVTQMEDEAVVDQICKYARNNEK